MLMVMPRAVRGPLSGPVMDELAQWLVQQRYAHTMVPQILGVARGLSAWMDDQCLPLDHLDGRVLEDFQASYGLGVPGHVIVRMRLPALRRFFIETGRMPGRICARRRTRRPVGQARPVVSAVVASELDEWGRWQREVRGISQACIQHRRDWVTGLVESLPVTGDALDWVSCDVAAVNSFIVARAEGLSAASRSGIVDAARCLLRWALASGRLSRDLTGGVLRARSTRITLPKGLAPEQVSALLEACDQQTVVGVRDRAVITVLWRLGLRAGETARLGLDDVDWAAGRLTVVGKAERRLTLPIPVDVGKVLVGWLRVRPASTDRAVFVRVRKPIVALTSAGISDIVKHRAEDAALGAIHAHRLRHTAAMNVIAAGGNMLEAQELLGHHHAASTRVYARTDLASLHTLTVPFGEVPR